MNPYVRSPRRASPDAIPNVIFALLVANGLVFASQQFLGSFLVGYFALWPATAPDSGFMPWQLLTYAFLHVDIMHIAVNMLMLWMFGRDVESLMGARRFLAYYFTCIVGAALVQLLVAALQGSDVPTLGASGGVFGILLAYGMAYPNRVILLLFPPVPMKAKYLVILSGLFELYLGIAGSAPGIAHFAHLGGMLFGFLLLQYWTAQRRR